jgi:AraC-like DNA-binding protein
MNRFVPLHRTAEFTFGRFDHPPGESHCDPVEESASSFSINLVDGGDFNFLQSRHERRLGPGDLLLTYPGARFRIHHRHAFPRDTCQTLSVHFPPGPATRALAQSVRHTPVRKPARRTAFVLRYAASQPHLSMGLEVALLNLCSDLLQEHAGKIYSLSGPERSCVSRAVEHACAIFETEFDQTLSLGDVARRVQLSPFHFARTFSALTGLPPHRFLIRIRLLHALRLLRQGASVTDACFRSGFSHLSHFSITFERTFGVLPSVMAKMSSLKSKKLIARSWLPS